MGRNVRERGLKSLALTVGTMLVTASFDRLLAGQLDMAGILFGLALVAFVSYEMMQEFQIEARVPPGVTAGAIAAALEAAAPRVRGEIAGLTTASSRHFECEECGKAFPTEAATDEHVAKAHGEWTFEGTPSDGSLN